MVGGRGGSGGGGGDVVDQLRGEGVVFVHEAQVGLEARRGFGGRLGGFEHAGRVGGEVGFDGGC